MESNAVVMKGPGDISLEKVHLSSPNINDVVLKVHYSGISVGTEKLFWSGEMPKFPGMGYPLIPGYESVGEIIECSSNSNFKCGDFVFIPGANCYGSIKGLFGGASQKIVSSPSRLIKIDKNLGPEGSLFALAATARHAIAGFSNDLPELIVGHGVLGRLLARLTLAAGGNPPVVWENDISRFDGSDGYEVIHPDNDNKNNYKTIYDVSGDANLLDRLISRISKGGEIVLAGFYPGNLKFQFSAAFIKEAKIRISSEFNNDDIITTKSLIETGDLSLKGLISDISKIDNAVMAYKKAFDQPSCLKMVIDWKEAA